MIRRRKTGFFVLLFALSSFLPVVQAGDGLQPGPQPELRIVELEGTPYEMGVAHGRALKVEIQELVGLWKSDLEKTYQVKADVFIREFLRATDFKPVGRGLRQRRHPACLFPPGTARRLRYQGPPAPEDLRGRGPLP